MNVSEIKDPRVRARIEAADAAQNGPAGSAEASRASSKASGAAHNRNDAIRRLAKRVRQSAKPLLNKLESEFLENLRAVAPGKFVRCQALRYRLGNGIWYKPDFSCVNWKIDDGECGPVAWEVKGQRAFRGGFENLKVAASLYPEVRWLLVWKDQETGEWQEQHILP